MQRVRLRLYFVGLILISSILILNFSDVNAESEPADEFYLLQKQGEILSSNDFEYITGVSSHEIPFFSYRIEGYDSLGSYFYGTTETTMSESLISINNGNMWEWKILIDFDGECSCKVHISQLDYTSEVLETETLAIWLNSENTDQNQESTDSYIYPILIPDVNFPTLNLLDVKPLEFNNQLDIYAEIYSRSEINNSFEEKASVTVFDYITSGLEFSDNSSMISIAQTEIEEGKYKIHYSMSLENYSEGIYILDFNSEVYSLWGMTYFFEIDRTLPIAVINADDSVQESLDWVYVNATGSFDPKSSFDVLFEKENTEILQGWIFEGPDGTTSLPTQEMLISPNQLRFLPLNEGNYTFTLIVVDVAGNVNQTSHVIKVENVVPIGIICDLNNEQIDYAIFDYNGGEINELFFSADLSTDSVNEIEELQFGWYLDGVLFSSTNNTIINIEDIESNVELKLVVKDSDGEFDEVSLILNQVDVNPDSHDIKSSNSDLMNGINLVLLTAFICVIVLLFVKKKSIEENPLPKWSKYNKKQ